MTNQSARYPSTLKSLPVEIEIQASVLCSRYGVTLQKVLQVFLTDLIEKDRLPENLWDRLFYEAQYDKNFFKD